MFVALYQSTVQEYNGITEEPEVVMPRLYAKFRDTASLVAADANCPVQVVWGEIEKKVRNKCKNDKAREAKRLHDVATGR